MNITLNEIDWSFWLLVGFIGLCVALGIIAICGSVWNSITPYHEADLTADEYESTAPLEINQQDREFHEPRTNAGFQINADSIQIICARCQTESNLLRALPNGDVVCPACHEKLVLDAVFAPLE